MKEFDGTVASVGNVFMPRGEHHAFDSKLFFKHATFVQDSDKNRRRPTPRMRSRRIDWSLRFDAQLRASAALIVVLTNQQIR